MKFSFTLDRSTFEKSIFCDVDCYEVVNPKMINGFIKNKMGIKFHKKGKFKNMPYTTELELMRKYKTNMTEGKVAVKYKMAKHKWGRVQPEGCLSLSLFHRPTRHTLCNDFYVDFDMVNAQPSAVNQICLQNGIHNKNFIEYCKDPKTFRYAVAKHHNLKPIYDKETGVTLSSYEQAKKLFLSLSFGGSYAEWKKTYNAENADLGEVIEMEKEISDVMDRIYKYNVDMIDDLLMGDDKWRKKSIPERKRSVMGVWAQSIERMLQETCILSLCKYIGFSLSSIVPCQDGFMLLKTEMDKFKDVCDIPTIISGMEQTILNSFGFDIKWEVKPFDEQLKGGIPLCDDDGDGVNKTYDELKTEFEKNHTKIINLGAFFKTETDMDINMTKTHLITSYEHLRFNVIVKGETKDKSFITEWLKDGSINRKRDVDIVPPDLVCPDDIYNAWRPFAMELIPTYTEDTKVIEFMKNHIMILCDHNQQLYDYFIKWIAMCIQFPSVKLPMPVFVSGEGAGKGSLLKLFTAIMGKNKILLTQNPSVNVWGQFNSMMLNAYLVCLDEISKKEIMGCEGIIKGLITEPTININDKGKPHFPIKSYHKFISFSNPDHFGNEPMTTTEGDRRKFFIMCSNELIGNVEYFKEFNAYLSDVNAMKNVYEYFKQMEDVKTILKDKLPETEYHKELKQIAIPPLKLFLMDYLRTWYRTEDSCFERSTDELYEELQHWSARTGIKYECNKLQFGCRLANMRLQGMQKTILFNERIAGWSFTEEIKKVLGIEEVEEVEEIEEIEVIE